MHEQAVPRTRIPGILAESFGSVGSHCRIYSKESAEQHCCNHTSGVSRIETLLDSNPLGDHRAFFIVQTPGVPLFGLKLSGVSVLLAESLRRQTHLAPCNTVYTDFAAMISLQ